MLLRWVHRLRSPLRRRPAAGCKRPQSPPHCAHAEVSAGRKRTSAPSRRLWQEPLVNKLRARPKAGGRLGPRPPAQEGPGTAHPNPHCARELKRETRSFLPTDDEGQYSWQLRGTRRGRNCELERTRETRARRSGVGKVPGQRAHASSAARRLRVSRKRRGGTSRELQH